MERNWNTWTIGFVFLFLIAMGFSCKDNDVSSSIGEDITDPVIRVENINQGDTLAVNFDVAGITFDVDILDETGLAEYSLTISKNDEAVIEQAESVDGTQQLKSVDISLLETNIEYLVAVHAEDASGNFSVLNFSLIISFHDAVVDYENLYLVGSATSGGYDLSQQSPMIQDPNNPNIFTWTDTLKTGEFKIKTYSEEDFCLGDWIHPQSAEQDLSATDYEILAACVEGNTDFKWIIEENGIYSITLNFLDETISIVQDRLLGEIFEEVYMIGSATPGGWDLAAQTALTQSNTFSFSWTGALTAGEFKFKLYAEQDFCAGKWIHPVSANQNLSDTDFEILVGCADNNPDYKWVIDNPDAGDYSITINFNNSTIHIEKR